LISLFVTEAFSQSLNIKSAADEIIFQIEQIEKGHSYDFKTPNRIACLTGIYPKDFDGTYLGVVYYPTNQELLVWKDFVRENQAKFKFKEIPSPKVAEEAYFNLVEILFEYEPDRFRSSFCEKQ
jgi:hypothetical protein